MYTSKINSWQKLLFVFLRLADCLLCDENNYYIIFSFKFSTDGARFTTTTAYIPYNRSVCDCDACSRLNQTS